MIYVFTKNMVMFRDSVNYSCFSQVTDKGADNSDNQSSLDLKAVSSDLTQVAVIGT